MVDFIKQILQAQFEAALCMLHQCIAACPSEHWESKIANGTFRWVAYHTLFFTDLYLSPSEHQFEPRDFHERGGDERASGLSPGLSQEETLAYVSICRQKLHDSLASETRESLEGESGFSYRRITRGELYIYNLRHIQHHTGQLSAYLRRIDNGKLPKNALPWVGTGWKTN